MNKLLMGFVYGLLAQILTFLQLQGGTKYGWFIKYPIITVLASIPMGWLFLKSVENLVGYFDGEIWPSRLIGFGIGIIVFGLMSYYMFKEPISLKTAICLILAIMILAIQIFWK
jgi:multidrug transporter EmrE-like cation transporter